MRDSLQVAATERLAERISDWLSAPDPSINLATARKKRQQDTGNWLLHSPVFLDWTKTNCSFLWLHGKAGSGKTVLSSTAIHSLFEAPTTQPIVLYYYFDFQERQKQLVQNFVRSVIVQLSNQHRPTVKIVEGLFNSHFRASTSPMLPELIDVIRRMMEKSPKIYLVVDALDECEDRKSLLEFLVELRSWNQTNLHILATSRRETEIEDSLSASATHRISLEESVVDADILTYVSHQLQHDPKLSKWPKDIREEIRLALLEGASGMFRWVECQMDAIRGCMKPAQLRRTLKSLPKTLDETYARILSNVGEDYVEDVQRVLSCLIYLFCPVAIEELAETVAIVPQGETYYDIESRLLEPRDIVTLCSGLVTTTRSRRTTLMGGPQIPIEEVRLAHFSVKEYLVSDRIITSQTSKFYIEERLAHEALANLSLRYLIFCHQEKLCEDPDFLFEYETTFLRKAAFAPYAASFWSHHLRAAQLHSSSPLYQKCLEILTHPPLLKDLIRLRRPWFRPSEVTIMRCCGYIETYNGNHQYNPGFKSVPPLYYASLLGLDGLVSMLLKKGEDVNSFTSEGSSLVAAISGGHQSVVDLLLANAADVNAKTLQTRKDEDVRYSRTAIHEAMYNRHEGNAEIVRSLLAAGADVNIERGPSGTDDDSNTPLQAAVYKRNQKLVELMLGAGADPNASTGHLGTALERAAILEKSNDIMTMLLNAGADPNLVSNPSGIHSPLWETITSNNPSGTRLLVERGVDPQTIDSRIVDAMGHRNVSTESALVAAIKTVARIRPDINLEKLLTSASQKGYTKVMEVLLQSGTIPNIQETSGKAALRM